MKTLLANLALRDARYGLPQTDDDVGAIPHRHFYINVRSIRWPPEIDQRQPTANPGIKETVSALFDPKETRNYIGKAFFETWCDTHGYFKPKIDIVWIEFSIDGQTQRFKSVHQITENGEAVQFYPNRSPAKPHRRSLLEEHIREYSNSFSQRHGGAEPKEVVAVRSRTWSSSLRWWPQIPGNQHDKSIILLNKPKDNMHSDLPPTRSDKVAESRGKSRESLAQYASGDALPDDVSATMATSSVAISAGCGSRQNNSTEVECTASSNDPCVEQISTSYNLIDPVPRPAYACETSRELAMGRLDKRSNTTLYNNLCSTSSCQSIPTILAETHASLPDERPQDMKSAGKYQDETLTRVIALKEGTEPGIIDDISLNSEHRNSSDPGEGLGVEDTRPWAQSTVVSQQSVQDGIVRYLSLDTDCLKPDPTMGSPNTSEYFACTDELRCHSVIRDIRRASIGLSGVLEQKGQFGIESTREAHNGPTLREVSSSGRTEGREPESPMKKPYWLDRVSVREDEPPNSAKSFRPAVASSAAIPPARTVGRLDIPEIQYTSVAMETSSKKVADSKNGEQKPHDSDETATWDLCHESDQDSMYSSDGEGLPFPDDYWVYDEKVKNYYHVEVGDDGSETISWYPLEFD